MHPLETYLRDLYAIHSSGAAVPETSYYGPLANLLNEAGKGLRPRVRCIVHLQDRGAGIPDGGFFAAEQFEKATALEPLPGQLPARGALEVKDPTAGLETVARGEQV